MPNTYLKPEAYRNALFAELTVQENLGGLITPFSGEEFIGKKNDTLKYKTQGVTIARDYEFRSRTAPIIFDEIYRNELLLTIDQHMTVANRWTDEERTFDAPRIRADIAAPMAEAMVTRFDRKILAALLAANAAITNLDGTEPDPATEAKNAALKIALGWKTRLDASGMPRDGRILVLGANPYVYFAASPSTLAYDPAQARSVFQRGVYGQIANFNIFNGTEFLGENEIVALHPSWAVLPNAAPAELLDVSFQSRGVYGGYSARLAAQAYLEWASDALLLNTFWGVSEIADQYARHTAETAAAANDGSEKGDIIIVDGKTSFTGYNARIARGTWTPDT